MDENDWQNLDVGDVIRHKMNSAEGYVVQANYLSGGVLITRCQLASNPREWDLVSKAYRDIQAIDVTDDPAKPAAPRKG
jgi:hypothetical protein